MELAGALLVIMRWAHALAAVTWVGGSLFYLVVLEPSIQPVRSVVMNSGLVEAISKRFNDLVGLCIWVFLITGAVLTFDRLGQGSPGVFYVVLLAIKIALSLWMFLLVQGLSPRRNRQRLLPSLSSEGSDNPTPSQSGWRLWLAAPRLGLLLGLAIYLLVALLRVVYEANLRSPG